MVIEALNPLFLSDLFFAVIEVSFRSPQVCAARSPTNLRSRLDLFFFHGRQNRDGLHMAGSVFPHCCLTHRFSGPPPELPYNQD